MKSVGEDLLDKQVYDATDGPVRFSFGLGNANASDYGKMRDVVAEGEIRRLREVQQTRALGIIGGGVAIISAVRGVSTGRGWVNPLVLFGSGAAFILESFKQ